MADDSNKLSIKDFIEDDGTLDGLIRQLGDIIELVDMLEKMLKKDDVTKWTNGLKQGSLDYKIALQAATSLAEKLVATSTKLTEVRMAETKELARLEQLIKDENRERQREAEINSKAAGSYARMKLELKQLIDQYKEAGTVEGKVKIAGEMSRLSSNIMLADRQLKLMLNDYSNLTGAQKQVLAETERQIAASNAATKAVRDRAAAEAKLKTKASQSADSSAEERVNAALQKRIAIETELNKLSDAEANKSMSSADIIQKRIALKQQLASIDGEVKQLEAELTMEQKVVAAQEKLNNLRRAATTVSTDTNRSQIEEIAYNEELAVSIKKTEEARAQAAVAATDEYRDMIQAQNELKKARLEAIAQMDIESKGAEELAGGTYAQLEARYKLLVLSIQELDSTSESYDTDLEKLQKKLNKVADQLEAVDKASGKVSNRMSSRQREWNGLTNSVYQLSRELPNLAVRADTFFLAISNNIPIFVDEFKRAKKELGSFKKALAETGKAFAKSIPLALVLLALSKFSELQKAAESFFGTLEDGTLKAGYAYARLAENVEHGTKKFAEQMTIVGMLKRKWDSLDSLAQREEFLFKYREELDKTGFAINNVNEAENFFEQATGKVVQSFLSRAQAAAAMEAATGKYEEALKKMAKVEEKASAIMGTPTTIADIQNMFLREYGLSSEALLPNGKIAVTPEQLQKIARDYEAYVVAEGYGRWPAGLKNITARDRMKANVEAGLGQELTIGDYASLAILKAINQEQKLGDKRQLRVAAQELEEIFAQAEQFGKFYEMFIEQGKSAEEAILAANKAIDDLRKKIAKLTLDSIKYLNDKTLSAITNQEYARGGRSVTYGSVSVDNGVVTYGDNDVTTTIKNSFDKAKYEARLGLDEVNQEIANKVAEANDILRQTTDEGQQAIIRDAINRYEQAGVEAAQAFVDGVTQTEAEKTAAFSQLYADNIANRLAAAKKGTEEEHALRIRSIRANMNAEIAENATLEPALRKSVSAIRDKYRKEEEDAEREWLIHLYDMRKQVLEDLNAKESTLVLDYYKNRIEIEELELKKELLENKDLIEAGLLDEQAIIGKHLKNIEKLWDDHRNAVLSSQKSMWDVVEELSTPDSYEQLQAQLHKYDIELEQTKIQQKELIGVNLPREIDRIDNRINELNSELSNNNELTQDQIALYQQEIEQLTSECLEYVALSDEVANYLDLLTRLNEQRKKQAEAQMNLRNFEKQQEIDEIYFNMTTYQAGERQQQMFALEHEKQLLEYRRDNAAALGLSAKELELISAQLAQINQQEQRIGGLQGTINAVANHGLAGLIQLPDVDPTTGKQKKGENGQLMFKDLSSDQYDALDTALDSIKSNLNEVMQAYVDVAQAAYDAAQAQVDAARTVYETELEARANGYANDVEGAKRELALEKQKAKQKEAILKQAQKAQEHINTLQQISSLITGSAQILETFGAYPVIAGVLLAAMWGMFAMAKVKAAQVASQSSTYGEGGFELAVGGSHASGHDIKTGIQTQSGRNMVIEGGEGVGVFSRKAVSKYGNAIPKFVDAINDGSLSDLGYSPSDVLNGMAYEDLGAMRGSQYAKEILSLQPLTSRVDLTTVEGLLSVIISKQVGQPVVLPDGSIFERKGNKTTITRRN